MNVGEISDGRKWLDFVDDFAAIGCRMPDDDEFQRIAAGSNEETNIARSADPVTTGGHSDTAGRRMISNIGLWGSHHICVFQFLRMKKSWRIKYD